MKRHGPTAYESGKTTYYAAIYDGDGGNEPLAIQLPWCRRLAPPTPTEVLQEHIRAWWWKHIGRPIDRARDFLAWPAQRLANTVRGGPEPEEQEEEDYYADMEHVPEDD